jgi:hypothetical protein
LAVASKCDRILVGVLRLNVGQAHFTGKKYVSFWPVIYNTRTERKGYSSSAGGITLSKCHLLEDTDPVRRLRAENVPILTRSDIHQDQIICFRVGL